MVKGTGPSLIGRNWLKNIKLNWHQINLVKPGPSTIQVLLDSHSAVFQSGLGALKGYQARIELEESATPKFSKARSVPYAYRDLVEKELDRLVQEGTL